MISAMEEQHERIRKIFAAKVLKKKEGVEEEFKHAEEVKELTNNKENVKN